MLSLANREKYRTLLDAAVLRMEDTERDAIIYVATGEEPVHISRADFHREAARYAATLSALGVGARDLVVIAHTQNLESIYAFWGAMLVGAIPSMFPTLTEKLDPAVYMHSMAELTRLSQVRAVFTTDEFAPLLAEQVLLPLG